MNIVNVRAFGTACRGQLDSGGWVSIIASGGTRLWERVGDREFSVGKHCAVRTQKIYAEPDAKAKTTGKTVKGEFDIRLPRSQAYPNDGGEAPTPADAFTVSGGDTFAAVDGGFVKIVDSKVGVTCTRIVEGINDGSQPSEFEDFVAVPQMMLVSDMVSDMVLVWDQIGSEL